MLAWGASGGWRHAREGAEDLAFRRHAVRITGASYRPWQPDAEVDAATARRMLAAVAQGTTSRIEALLETGDLDRALEILKKTSGAEAEPAVTNDLAAALYLRAVSRDQPEDLLEGLRHLETELSRNPASPEALFNRALLLEELVLPGRAIAAWERYLAVDFGSPWAVDARERLVSLQTQAAVRPIIPDVALLDQLLNAGEGELSKSVATDPQRWLKLFDETLVPDLIQAAPDVQQLTGGRVTAVAKALAGATGDPQTVDIAKSLADPRHLADPAWVAAHRRFVDACVAHHAWKAEEAEAGFRVTNSEFPSLGSPLAPWARFFLGVSQYRLKRFDQALAIFTKLGEEAETAGHTVLFGRARWLAGLSEASTQRPVIAQEHYVAAEAALRQAGLRGHQASVTSLMAFNFDYFGDPRQAWRQFREALRGAWSFGDQGALPVILSDVARSLVRDGYPELALEVVDEALEIDRAIGDTVGTAEDLWWRAISAHAAKRPREVEAALGEGNPLAATLSSREAREHLQAGYAAVAGAAARSEDPEKAVAILTDALSFFRPRAMDGIKTEALLERGLALRALGRGPEAEADFEEGIRYFEASRRRVGDAPQQIVYFNRARDVFDALIDYQWNDLADPWKALTTSERGRARALLEDLGGREEMTPLRLRQMVASLQRELDPETALLAFDFIGEQLLVWVIRSGGVHAEARSIPMGWRKTLNSSLGTDFLTPDNLRLLYRVVLSGLEEHWPGVRRLVIVPDENLALVPFGALLQPSGRYLIEDFEISLAPSLAAIRLLEGRIGSFADATSLHVVALGNGTLDSAGRVPPLPNAEGEAEAVAALYPSSLRLIGAAATKEALTEAASSADVVHIATHALNSPDNPQSARILLAGQSSGSDLTAVDIAALRLVRAPIIFLGACGGAAGDTSTSEGRLDLARPFIGAGARAVVASLWNVDDEMAIQFSINFHKNLIENRRAAGALRDTQLSMLRSPRAGFSEPTLWGGYQVIGIKEP